MIRCLAVFARAILSTMRTTTKAYRFRAYPDSAQIAQLEIDFNVARWAWNISLDARSFCYSALGRSVNSIDCSKAIAELKRDPDYAWVRDANSTVITQTLRDQEQAFQNFFAGRAKYPQFKSKRQPPSVRYQIDQRQIHRTFNAATGLLVLPKLGALKLRWSRPVIGVPKMVTVRRDAVGDYFVSFTTEQEQDDWPKTGRSAGVDVGIKDVMVTSDGVKSGAPKYTQRYQRQLKRAQQTLSRRVKGSARWRSAKRRVAKIQRKIANSRKDFLHKLTTWLVRTYDTIALEDLNVAGMLKNHSLAKAISDASFGELVRQVLYKAQWYGKQVLRCGRFEPSTKLCSGCGTINTGLTLADRVWSCDCGLSHDRDINAARNILKFAAGRAVTARGDLAAAGTGMPATVSRVREARTLRTV